jgi:hypothetical protein
MGLHPKEGPNNRQGQEKRKGKDADSIYLPNKDECTGEDLQNIGVFYRNGKCFIFHALKGNKSEEQ